MTRDYTIHIMTRDYKQRHVLSACVGYTQRPCDSEINFRDVFKTRAPCVMSVWCLPSP